MKMFTTGALLVLALGSVQTAKDEHANRLVLPNSKLLACKSADCFQLWSARPDARAVFPYQVVMDMNQNCLYGMRALYDKSISVKTVQAAIDERYEKWAVAGFANSSVKLWRVEPEKFAIQLSEADKDDEEKNVAEAGAKQVIYLAFGGRSACKTP